MKDLYHIGRLLRSHVTIAASFPMSGLCVNMVFTSSAFTGHVTFKI